MKFIGSPFSGLYNVSTANSDGILESNKLLLYPSKVQGEMLYIRYDGAAVKILKRLSEGALALEEFTVSIYAWSSRGKNHYHATFC